MGSREDASRGEAPKVRSKFWRLLLTGAHFRVRACISPEPPKLETPRSLPLYIPAIGIKLVQLLHYSKVDRSQYKSCMGGSRIL